jgi:transposase
VSNQELIRRQQYCQIVQEIAGSDQYMVVGIDIGKDKHHAFMGTAIGKSLFRKLIFENNIDGFSRLLRTADEIRSQNDISKIVYGLEPTGNYHKPLAKHLIRFGSNLVLVSGEAVKKNRALLDGRWDKHDTKCAANIADLVSRGRCLYYDSPSSDIIELRSLLSLRRRLKKEEHSLRMRIRNNLLALYFPELDRFYSACENETLAIVKWCLDPDQIAGMDFEPFFQMVTRTRRGTAQLLRLRKIHQQASESIGCPMGSSATFEAQLLVDKPSEILFDLKTENSLSKWPDMIYVQTEAVKQVIKQCR